MKMQFVIWCLWTAAIAGAQQTPPAGPRKPPAAPPADAGATVDSLGVSLQDLNAIRDGNLSRVQKDGACPPETAARLADLRLKLRRVEAELSGGTLSSANPVDAQSIAAGWFKRPAPEPESAVARESRLVAEVLPGAVAPAAKPRQSAEQQKALEEEIARLKAETARLAGTCAPVKK
jgi:hypothetical protein